MSMSRWIMIALAVGGFLTAFMTGSPGLLGFALLLGFIGLFGVVMSIAADRISSNMRPETAMLQPEVIAALRERAKAQAAQQHGQVKPGATVAQRQGYTDQPRIPSS